MSTFWHGGSLEAVDLPSETRYFNFTNSERGWVLVEAACWNLINVYGKASFCLTHKERFFSVDWSHLQVTLVLPFKEGICTNHCQTYVDETLRTPTISRFRSNGKPQSELKWVCQGKILTVNYFKMFLQFWNAPKKRL